MTAVRTDRASGRDEGSVFVLALVLTIVLAIMTVGLANHVASGRRRSDVTGLGAESRAAALAGLQWYVEELSARRITPDCVLAADGSVPVVPRAIAEVDVVCESEAADTADPPTVELTASGRSDGAIVRVVQAVVEIPPDGSPVRITAWGGAGERG